VIQCKNKAYIFKVVTNHFIDTLP